MVEGLCVCVGYKPFTVPWRRSQKYKYIIINSNNINRNRHSHAYTC